MVRLSAVVPAGFLNDPVNRIFILFILSKACCLRGRALALQPSTTEERFTNSEG